MESLSWMVQVGSKCNPRFPYKRETKHTHTRNRLPIARLTSDSTQTGKRGNRMPIAGLTSDSEPTNTPRKPTANRWTYVRLQHTQRGAKEKGRPERSTHLLPTYLIWYEDQGDVAPLNRGETFS